MLAEITYADDTTIIATDEAKLQTATRELLNVSSKWGLHTNAAKCSTLPICAHGTHVRTHLGPIEVDTVKSFKYLGSLQASAL